MTTFWYYSMARGMGIDMVMDMVIGIKYSHKVYKIKLYIEYIHGYEVYKIEPYMEYTHGHKVYKIEPYIEYTHSHKVYKTKL